MKKIFIIFSIFILSSCFFSGNSKSNTEKNKILNRFENKNFSFLYPSSWEIIKNTKKVLPKPVNGEIVFVSYSNKIIDNYKRNIVVLKQEVDNNLNSLEYSAGNYFASKKEYYYIKDLANKKTQIDGQNTIIYEFEAKYSEDTKIYKFIQTGIICKNTGYLITIGLEKNNKNLNRYEQLLTSFKCKK